MKKKKKRSIHVHQHAFITHYIWKEIYENIYINEFMRVNLSNNMECLKTCISEEGDIYFGTKIHLTYIMHVHVHCHHKLSQNWDYQIIKNPQKIQKNSMFTL